MLINPFVYAVAGGGGGGGVNSGWNPADAKASKFSFSNSNRNATSIAGGDGSVRAVSSKTAGKRYWEVRFTDSGDGATSYWVCVADSAMPLSGLPGFGFTGGSFGAMRANGQVTNNGGYVGAFGNTFVANGLNTLMAAFDFSTGAFGFGMNGAFLGSTIVGAGFGAMFPAITLEGIVGPPGGVQLLTLASELIYPVPGGYTAWET